MNCSAELETPFSIQVNCSAELETPFSVTHVLNYKYVLVTLKEINEKGDVNNNPTQSIPKVMMECRRLYDSHPPERKVPIFYIFLPFTTMETGQVIP